MEFLSRNEIKHILQQCGILSVSELKWSVENYSEKLIGLLGEHLSLKISFQKNGVTVEKQFFVKCIPRFNEEQARLLRNTDFFAKEYIMLSKLFKNFKEGDGARKFRPKLFYAKEELFVFEDVKLMGYTMPNLYINLEYDEILATVAAVAKFHAQSYIFEEHQSKKLKRPYKIWEDYSEYLNDSVNNMPWRDTGMKALIDFLKIFSEFKSKSNVMSKIEEKIPNLFKQASDLMKPSSKYRNVVVHRDIWTNNILLKTLENGQLHALIVDFQTVVYCAPMLDLSSLLYFNTSKEFRATYTERIIEFYYDILKQELQFENINILSIVDKQSILESYEESAVFGMTQAALIVPIMLLDEERKQVYNDPMYIATLNFVSRSQIFIDLAKEDNKYRERVLELFDEIAEKIVNSLNLKNS
ncbi:unnamed protein product, partial [Brenthis ino]